MSNLHDNTASAEIFSLRSEIQSQATTGVDLPVTQMRIIADRLRAIGSLVHLMEQELAVHRLGEQGRDVFGIIETEAGKILAEPVVEKDGNVLHLDFGGRD
ncbi:hypothetical protein [Ensifer canadensis]